MDQDEVVLSDEQLGELAAGVHKSVVAGLRKRGFRGARLKGARLGSELALATFLSAMEEMSGD